MDDLKKNGIEDAIRTPQHKGKTVRACSLSHTQPPTHPLPARQDPRGHRGLHLRMGCDQEGHGGHASHAPRSPAPRSQGLLTVSHSSTSSPAGREVEPEPPASCHPACCITFHAFLPTSIKGKKRGGANHPPAGSSWRKPHACPGGSSLDKGSVRSSSVSSGLASGVQVPVPPFSSSWHPSLPFPDSPPSSSI